MSEETLLMCGNRVFRKLYITGKQKICIAKGPIYHLSPLHIDLQIYDFLYIVGYITIKDYYK